MERGSDPVVTRPPAALATISPPATPWKPLNTIGQYLTHYGYGHTRTLPYQIRAARITKAVELCQVLDMDLTAHEPSKRQPANGFKPGNNANPYGRSRVRGLDELTAQLAADLPGIETSAIDMALLGNAALLLLRAKRMAAGDRSVRSSSEARRTLEALRRRYSKPAKPKPTALADYLDSKIAEKSASETDGGDA